MQPVYRNVKTCQITSLKTGNKIDQRTGVVNLNCSFRLQTKALCFLPCFAAIYSNEVRLCLFLFLELELLTSQASMDIIRFIKFPFLKSRGRLSWATKPVVYAKFPAKN